MGPHRCRTTGLESGQKSPFHKGFCMRNRVVENYQTLTKLNAERTMNF